MIAGDTKEIAKYQPYPEYKDSGVEWLGKIPRHWDIKKIAWYFKAQKGRNAQMLTREFCGENTGDYPVYSGQTENNGVMGCIDSYEFDAGQDGCLFATTVGAKAMTLSLLRGKFSLSQNCMVIMPTSNLLVAQFYFYHCQPLFFYERGRIPEHMQASFRMEDLYQYQIAMAPLQEQQTIASFLDYETARIDRLIARQQQLIELLKEKRQAVISHAVTKGLNPDAPMKDSGVEWLGQVPEHWKICRLKHIKSSQPNAFVDGPFGSNLKSEHFIENGDVYVIESSFATTGSLEPSELKTITSEHYSTIQRSSTIGGDIIIAKIGARFGSSAILPVLDKFAVVSGNSLKLTVNSDVVHVEYANHVIQHLKLEGALDDGVNVTAQPALSLGTLNNLCFVVPPFEEQQEILVKISAKSNEYKRLIEQAEIFVSLLQERRTALISAAVTGKIDLRGWTPPVDDLVS